jgi:hypothetical protein
MSGYGPIFLISEKATENVGKDLRILYLFYSLLTALLLLET